MWGYTAMTITHGVCMVLTADDLRGIVHRKEFQDVREHLRQVVMRVQCRYIFGVVPK
jgi:hypothetical protein